MKDEERGGSHNIFVSMGWDIDKNRIRWKGEVISLIRLLLHH